MLPECDSRCLGPLEAGPCPPAPAWLLCLTLSSRVCPLKKKKKEDSGCLRVAGWGDFYLPLYAFRSILLISE